MDPPRLHVVYSGRGDAMYVDYQDGNTRRLVLIDGGPRTFKMGGNGFNGDAAPYSKYYISTGRQIWTGLGYNMAFSPAAIIATHAHEDHIGGILTLIKTSLDNPGTMVFNGPLVMPRFKLVSGDTHVAKIWQQWVTDNRFFPISDQQRITYPTLPSLPNQFKLIYPEGDELVQLIDPSGVTPHPWSNWTAQDIKFAKAEFLAKSFNSVKEDQGYNLNHTSMIVTTQFPPQDPAVAQQQAIFTADQAARNVAYKMGWVDINCKPLVKYPNIPHYSVYKIQHHGSAIDSALWPTTGIPKSFLVETAVYGILEMYHDDGDRMIAITYEEQDRADAAGLKRLCGWIRAGIQAMNEVVHDLLMDLHSRHLAFRKHLYEGDNSQDLELPYPRTTKIIKYVWETLSENLSRMKANEWADDWDSIWEKPQAKIRFHETRSETKVIPTLQEWITGWIGTETGDFKKTIWQEFWDSHARFTSSKDFFSLFTADAYVVSANSDHGHPSPTTLVGLAMAVLQQGNRQASLYVTSAHSLRWTEMKDIVSSIEGVTWRDLFHHVPHGNPNLNPYPPGAIKIFYLCHRFYITLDLTPGHIQDRGLFGHELVNLGRYLPNSATIHAQIEAKTKIVSQPVLGRVWRRVSADTIAGKYVMDVDAIGRPTVRGAGQLADDALLILEPWDVINLRMGWTRLMNRQNQQFIDVKFDKTSTFGNSNKWFASWAVDNQYWSFYETDNTGTAPPALRLDGELNDDLKMKWTFDVAAGPLQNFGNMDFSMASADSASALSIPHSILNNALWSPDPNELALQPVDTFLAGDFVEPSALQKYLDASSIVPPIPTKAKDALIWIINEENYTTLDFKLSYQLQALDYDVNIAQSTVSYTDNEVDLEVHAAKLSLTVPPNTQILVNGETLEITVARILLRWTVDRALTASLALMTNDGQLIAASKTNPRAIGQPPSLAKILTTMGHKALFDKLTIPSLLSIILAQDNKVQKLLKEQLPAVFLECGFISLVPDLNASTAKATYNTSDQIVLEKVNIVCKLAQNDEWKSSFQVGPFSATLTKLSVKVVNPRMPVETITITGEVKIKANGTELTASMLVTFEPEIPPLISFALSEGTALQEIVNILPGKPDISKLQVPLPKGQSLLTSGNETSSVAQQPFTDLASLDKTTLGFTVQQPTPRLGDYILHDVFATVKLDTWSDFIPDSFPKNLIAPPTIRVRVLNPLNRLRAVEAQVNSSLKLKLAQRTQQLNFEFLAFPLGFPGDYEFRIRVWADDDDNGCSVWDVIEKLGLAIKKTNVLDGIPFLQKALDQVYLRSVAVSLVQSATDGWKFGDWSLAVAIPEMSLLPSDNLRLIDLDARIWQESGGMSCSLHGFIYLPKVQKLIKVSAMSPEKVVPGRLEIDCGQGVSLKDIYNAFELPDVGDIPIVREVFEVELLSAYFVMGDQRIKGASMLGLLYSRCTFGYESLRLGIITLTAIEVSISYAIADPDVTNSKPARAFGLECTLADGALRAQFSYDTSDGKLNAALTPRKTMSIASTLDAMLSEDFKKYNILHSILGNLGLDQAKVEFGTESGYPLKHLLLEVSDKSALDLGRLNLQKFKIEFYKDKKSVNLLGDSQQEDKVSSGELNGDVIKLGSGMSDEVSAASLSILAQVTKGDVKVDVSIDCLRKGHEDTAEIKIGPTDNKILMMRGVLTLFSFERQELKLEVPQNCPDCFDVAITLIRGKLAIITEPPPSTKRSAVLRSFTLSANSEAPFTVLNQPAKIQVHEITLHVDYDSEGTESVPKGFSGFLSGLFQIKKTKLFVKYVYHPTLGHAFTGKTLKLQEPLQIVDLASSIGMTQQDYEIPDSKTSSWNLGPMNAVFLPKKLIEVHAAIVEAESPAQWPGLIGGVDLVLESLQIAFRLDYRTKDELTEPGPGMPPNRAIETQNTGRDDAKSHHEIWLHGKLRLKNLVALEAWLWIKSSEDSILTAILKKDQKTQSVSELTNLVSNADKSLASWQDVIPPTLKPLAFGETGVSLYANFTKKLLLLLGQIDTTISAALLVKTIKDKDTERKVYVFSMVVRDLASLWEPLRDTVTSQFPVINAAMHIQGFESKVKQLKEDLSLKEGLELGNGIILSDIKKGLAGMDDEESVKAGATFFAIIDIYSAESKPMKDVIALDLAQKSDLAPETTTKITLFAKLAKDEKEQTSYRIAVMDLFLCGGKLKINGSGIYIPTAKDPDPYFVLQTNLEIPLEFNNSEQTLKFAVDLSLTKSVTKFDTTATITGKTITNPLSGMFNVHIDSLGISGTSTKADGDSIQRDWKITGKARLGTAQSSSQIGAQIMFVNGKPLVVVLKYQAGTVGVSEIFESVVTPNPGTNKPVSWPKDEYDPIEFQSAVLTYAKGTEKQDSVTIGNDKYLAGFNFTANLLLFNKSFVISALLPKDRSGIALSGKYNDDINLQFAVVKKPEISLDTTKGPGISYFAKAGFTLFGVEGFSLDINYLPDKNSSKRIFKGTGKYNEALLGIEKGKVQLTVVYKDGKWGLEDWNMSLVNDALNILDAISKGSAKDGPCEALVDLAAEALSQLVKTKFRFILGLPKDRQKAQGEQSSGGSTFKFTLAVAYDLVISDKTVASIEMDKNKPMTFEIPFAGPLSIKNLLAMIWNTVTSPTNWEEIGKAILREPDKLAAVIAIIGVEHLGKETIKGLVCRKVQPKNVNDKARKDFEDDSDKVKEKIKDILKKVAEWATTAAAAAAAAGVIAGFLEGEGAGLLAGLTGPGTIGGKIMMGNNKDEVAFVAGIIAAIVAMLNSLRDTQNQIDEKMRSTLNMDGLLKADYVRDGDESTVVATWTPPVDKDFPVDTAFIKYDIRMDIIEQMPATEVLVTGLTWSNKDDKYRHVGKVYAWIQAIFEKDGQRFTSKTWARATATHMLWLRTPTGLDLQVQEADCVVTVPAVERGPADYYIELRMVAPGKSTPFVVYSRPFSGIDAGPHQMKVAITDLTSEQRRSGSLRAYAKQLSWDPSAVHESLFGVSKHSLSVLDPPAGLTMRMDLRNLVVDWSEAIALPAGFNYTVKMYRLSGEVISTLTEPAKSGVHSVTLALDAVKHQERVRVTVVASASLTTICLAESQEFVVIFPAQLTIGDVDCNTADSWLSISVSSDLEFAADSRFILKATKENVPDPIVLAPQSARTLWQKLATLRLLNLSNISLPANVQLALSDASGNPGAYSPPFLVTAPASVLNLGTMDVLATGVTGEWKVTWTTRTPDVDMVVCIEDPMDHQTFIIKTARALQGEVTFSSQECRGLLTEQGVASIGVFRMIKSGKRTGPSERRTFKLP